MNKLNKIYEKYFKDARNYDLLFIIGFILALILCFWKAPLEVQGSDESFYLTIPKRLLDGDVFVFDEWHGSQFSAFLIYPLMWLHSIIFGFEGIILHFRYIYILFQALISFIIYIRLREYKFFSIIAALFFFIFTPYDIMALSYNTMGLMLVTLTSVILATAKSKKAYFISGILFAASVLCCPYLIAAYVVYTGAVLIYAAIRKNKKNMIYWLMFTLGAMVLAVLLFVFILSRVSLSKFFEALPNLFTDPEHVSKPILGGIKQYFENILNTFLWGKFYAVSYIIFVIIEAFDKNRYKHKAIYITLSSVIALVMLIELAPSAVTNSYNFIMFPLCLVGLMSYIVTSKKNKRVFFFMFLGGMAYTMCIFFSSNQNFYIISAMTTAANVGSIILIHDAIFEEKYEEKSIFFERWLIVFILLFIQFAIMTNTKINHKFYSYTENKDLNVTISEGPYKGIQVTSYTNDKYLSELRALDILNGKKGKVLYSTYSLWYYFATPDLELGTYSAWLPGENYASLTRLSTYYDLNPDKVPDYIFMPTENSWDMNSFDLIILQKYGYERMDVTGGALYTRK